MVKSRVKIGVLDIQGSVKEHADCLKRAGAEVLLVKKAEDLSGACGLIIPGGESTTISKLLERFGLFNAIVDFALAGGAVWGTCAGAILLAKEIFGDDKVKSLALMDIVIARNAYGRQLDSFEGEVEFRVDKGTKAKSVTNTYVSPGEKSVTGDTFSKKIPAVFIRAPKIIKIGPDARVLAKYEDEIVALRQENLLATTFHPEMTDDLTVHRYFMGMAEG